MDIKALIVEQLDSDGTLRTMRLQPDFGRPLIVAFPHEYADPRRGPFHFLDPDDEQRYVRGFADCTIRHVAPGRFRRDRDSIYFLTDWMGIPTERNSLTLYSLLLPRDAVPTSIHFRDPRSNREFRKTVFRDDEQRRYALYLECRSSYGTFDFMLETEFVLDATGFRSSSYSDANTILGSHRQTGYQWLLEDSQKTRVQQFFNSNITMGDTYNAQPNGARIPNNPWISGSFYLVCILSVLAAIRVSFGQMSPWFMPIVVAGGVLIVSIIGAFQLRNDERLKEASFLKLMFKTLGYLPLLRTLLPHSQKNEAKQGEDKTDADKKD